MDSQENTEYQQSRERPPVQSTQSRLLRSKEDRILGGVCGGLGRYLELDPVLFRLAFILLLLAGGSGVLFYIIAWIIIPEADEGAEPLTAGDRSNAGLVIGGGLIVIGGIILIQRLVPWFDSRLMFALLLIAIGAFVVIRGVSRGK